MTGLTVPSQACVQVWGKLIAMLIVTFINTFIQRLPVTLFIYIPSVWGSVNVGVHCDRHLLSLGPDEPCFHKLVFRSGVS